MTKRWTRRGGSTALLEATDALPIVDLALRLPVGSLADPPGKGGALRRMARLLRRGPRGMDETAVEEAIARLGGRLALGITRESIELQGTVLAEHAPAFASLVGRLLAAPAFRARDLARAKREIRAELADVRDDDPSLAARHLRDLAFGDHPYGAPTGGTVASLRRVRREDLVEAHARFLGTGGRIVGAAGPLDRAQADALFDAMLVGVPRRRVPRPWVPATRFPRGRRVRIVHRPGRQQVQLGIAALGTHRRDPERLPLLVAETAFGGTFASELTHEIRSVRGWSYYAGSTLRAGGKRDLLELWAHPATEVAAACAERELELLARWAADGPRPEDLRRAKTYLVGSRAFDEETAARRLELAFLQEIGGAVGGFRTAVRRVTRASAAKAVRRRIQPRDLAIVAVGDRRVLRPALEALSGVSSVEVCDARRPLQRSAPTLTE